MLKNSPLFIRWSAFLGGLGLMWAFMFVIAPWGMRFEPVRTLTAYIEETGINASALYWSEVESTADAEHGARATVTYPPSLQKKSVTSTQASKQ